MKSLLAKVGSIVAFSLVLALPSGPATANSKVKSLYESNARAKAALEACFRKFIPFYYKRYQDEAATIIKARVSAKEKRARLVALHRRYSSLFQYASERCGISDKRYFYDFFSIARKHTAGLKNMSPKNTRFIRVTEGLSAIFEILGRYAESLPGASDIRREAPFDHEQTFPPTRTARRESGVLTTTAWAMPGPVFIADQVSVGIDVTNDANNRDILFTANVELQEGFADLWSFAGVADASLLALLRIEGPNGLDVFCGQVLHSKSIGGLGVAQTILTEIEPASTEVACQLEDLPAGQYRAHLSLLPMASVLAIAGGSEIFATVRVRDFRVYFDY